MRWWTKAPCGPIVGFQLHKQKVFGVLWLLGNHLIHLAIANCQDCHFKCLVNNSPIDTSAGHQWMVNPNIVCNQWLSLADTWSKSGPCWARNRSLVACTSMCGCCLRCDFLWGFQTRDYLSLSFCCGQKVDSNELVRFTSSLVSRVVSLIVINICYDQSLGCGNQFHYESLFQ